LACKPDSVIWAFVPFSCIGGVVTVQVRVLVVLANESGCPAQDPFEQIEKLAHLWEIGALTAEEFQATKSEILGWITKSP